MISCFRDSRLGSPECDIHVRIFLISFRNGRIAPQHSLFMYSLTGLCGSRSQEEQFFCNQFPLWGIILFSGNDENYRYVIAILIKFRRLKYANAIFNEHSKNNDYKE